MGLIGSSRRRGSTIAISQQLMQTKETFADMLSYIEANPSVVGRFVVTNDEFQSDTNVPYDWTGTILLEYGLALCDTQPNI